MWRHAGTDTSTAADAGTTTPPSYMLSLNGTGALNTLHILSQRPLQVAEDDQTLVCLLGRVRPYNQDYLPGDAAQWFLQLHQQQPQQFYPQIAGFFVLIIVDKHQGSVSIVNDHVGAVPFYIDSRQQGQLVLSDSLSLLRQHNPNVNLDTQAVYNYLYFHCIPSPDAIYQQIKKLEPGVAFTVGPDGSLHNETYYQPDFTPSTEPQQLLQQQCQQLISEAVARNISPDCAAFLSGGLDSSTVAGMLAKHSANTGASAKTYSIGFEAQGYDETAYALITAKHFGTEHKVHYLQPAEITQHFSTVAAAFNEPFGNSSAMAAYICAKVAADDGIKVLLAGDGGDEIFAGNERYVKQKTFEHYRALPGPLRSSLDLCFYNGLAAKLPGLKKAYSYINQAKVALPDRLDSYNFLNRFDINDMFCPAFIAHIDSQLPLQQKQQRYKACRSADAVDCMMYLDWKFTLADNDLVKVSSMCQLAGVEVRYPLFEKEVVDFSCKVSAGIKAPGQKLRDFYKRSFTGFLPDATLSKSKHGFGLPFGVWMKQQPKLQQITADSLASLKQRNIIQPSFIDKALATYQQGHSGYYGELVWIMVTLELWLQQHEAGYVA